MANTLYFKKDITDVTCIAHTLSVAAGYSDNISKESLFRSATAERDSRKSSVQGESFFCGLTSMSDRLVRTEITYSVGT